MHVGREWRCDSQASGSGISRTGDHEASTTLRREDMSPNARKDREPSPPTAFPIAFIHRLVEDEDVDLLTAHSPLQTPRPSPHPPPAAHGRPSRPSSTPGQAFTMQSSCQAAMHRRHADCSPASITRGLRYLWPATARESVGDQPSIDGDGPNSEPAS